MPKPLHRIIHTLGWPLRGGKAEPRVRRQLHLPDGRGDGRARPRRRHGLHRCVAVRARPAAGAEAPSARPRHPRGRARASPGARRRFPKAVSRRFPGSCTSPAPSSPATPAGFVNVPGAQGRPLRDALRACSRPRRRSTPFDPGATAWEPGALEPYDAAVRDSFIYKDLLQGSEHAPGLRQGPRARIGDGRDGDGLVRQGSAEEPEGRRGRRKRRSRSGRTAGRTARATAS